MIQENIKLVEENIKKAHWLFRIRKENAVLAYACSCCCGCMFSICAKTSE